MLPPTATLSPELGDGFGGDDARQEPSPKEKGDEEEDGEANDEAGGEPREPPQLPLDPGAIGQIGPALTQALAQAATMAPLFAKALEPSGDGAPSATETRFDRDFGRDADGFASDDADDFDADADPGFGRYGPIPATVEGICDYLLWLRDCAFGDGAPMNGVTTADLGRATAGNPGVGATFEAYGSTAQRMANVETAIDNLKHPLRTTLEQVVGIHEWNRGRIDAILQRVYAQARDAAGLPEVEREIKIRQILERAMLDAAETVENERTNIAESTKAINRLTAQLTDQFLGDLGPLTDSSTLDRLIRAVRAQESEGSGGYSAENDDSGALGAYQIMPENLNGVWDNWDREALGRDVSTAEFKNSPAIQDAIARYKLGQYLAKYEDPRLAAAAWYGGEKNVHLVNTTHPQGEYPSFSRYTNSVLGKM